MSGVECKVCQGVECKVCQGWSVWSARGWSARSVGGCSARSVRGWSVKCFQPSAGPDTALRKDLLIVIFLALLGGYPQI